MSLKPWTLDQLKSQLGSRQEIKGWVISQEHVHRRERYFLQDGGALATDQDREISAQNIQVRIMVRLPKKPDRQGEITKKFFSTLPLKDQLDSAIEAALQTDLQSWDLPAEAPTGLPQLSTVDPKIAEDVEGVMRDLTKQIGLAVSKKRPTRFNSAELFVSLYDREAHFSNGLTHRSSQSRIYAEAAYSMTKGASSDEYLSTYWSVSLQDLAIDKLFDETSHRAEHSLAVEKPVSGKYPVIVDAEVLSVLFNGYLSQLSAVNAYHRLPCIEPGKELIPGAQGDLITLTLDPTLAYGADTAVLSAQAVAQKKLLLVDRNKVVATSADKQYADYLGVKASTVRGNVVLQPGGHSYEDLIRKFPKVIEVLQFSALFPDPNSGTFSSEIRLARLHDNVRGTVSYIKGGSISGAISANFKEAYFSSQLVKRAHFEGSGSGYFGPDYALITDVSVVG